jgi:hypothetical protein
MIWFISKRSRNSGPYTGPSCKKAGVEPGKIYTNLEEAQRDAVKLNYVNPVGFWVYEKEQSHES